MNSFHIRRLEKTGKYGKTLLQTIIRKMEEETVINLYKSTPIGQELAEDYALEVIEKHRNNLLTKFNMLLPRVVRIMPQKPHKLEISLTDASCNIDIGYCLLISRAMYKNFWTEVEKDEGKVRDMAMSICPGSEQLFAEKFDLLLNMKNEMAEFREACSAFQSLVQYYDLPGSESIPATAWN